MEMKRILSVGFVVIVILIFALIMLIYNNKKKTDDAENALSKKILLKAEPIFTSLPLGSIKARGWLLRQLELQKEGFTGHAEELYPVLGSKSEWLGGHESGSLYDAAPYYIKGLIALAYTLDDETLINKSTKWIEWILNSQNKEGLFGPKTPYDWWSRMLVMYALQDYYDVSQDDRVIPFMLNYYQFMQDNMEVYPYEIWGKSRMGDAIDNIIWLYRKTGESFLINLAYGINEQGDNLTEIFSYYMFFDFPGNLQQSHNVNVSQGMKFAPVYYQITGRNEDRKAFTIANEKLIKYNGQPTGMTSGTEELGGLSSVQGVELCAIVERMQSNEEAQMILGESWIGDQLEMIAFNALPPVFDREMKLHSYYTMPNQVMSVYDPEMDIPFRQNHYNDLLLSPVSGWPCCRFNVHNPWPYYVKNMWSKTSNGGLAAMAYGPCEISVKLENGTQVTITEETNYPFEEQIRFTVHTDKKIKFPLVLRIPQWAESPIVEINGKKETVQSGEYFTILRKWKDKDVVTLYTPMIIKAEKMINDSVAIKRGPLVYSLKMEENWTKHDIQQARQFNTDLINFNHLEGFDEYQIRAKNSWNYGLLIDLDNIEGSIEVNYGDMPKNPFIQEETPITLTVDAKKIPEWGLGPDNIRAQEPPQSPVFSEMPTEKIELVPYGSEALRITYFPLITTNRNVNKPINYYAVDALLNNVSVKKSEYAGRGNYVGDIDNKDSFIEFNNVYASHEGKFELRIWYANGSLSGATQSIIINGENKQIIKYQSTNDWGIFQMLPIEISLKKGYNILRFICFTNNIDIDYIQIIPLD